MPASSQTPPPPPPLPSSSQQQIPPQQLLSLNIHDRSTFGGNDDLEICLHPDLGKEFRPGDLVEVSVWGGENNTNVVAGSGNNNNNNNQPQPLGRPTTTMTADAVTVVTGLRRSGSLQQQLGAMAAAVTTTTATTTASWTTNEGGGGGGGGGGSVGGGHPANDEGSICFSATTSGSLTNRSSTNHHHNNHNPDNVIPTAISGSPLLPPRMTTMGDWPLNKKQPPNNAGGNLLFGNKPPPVLRRANRKTSRHTRDLSDVTVDLSDTAAVAATTNENYNSNNNIPQTTNNNGSAADGGGGANNNNKRRLLLSITLLITEASLTSIKPGGRTQISILRPVADLYKLSPYDTVSVSKVLSIEQQQYCHAEFLLVTFKDQFISRGDMLLFQKSLIGHFVYEGKRLDGVSGFQAVARDVRCSSNNSGTNNSNNNNSGAMMTTPPPPSTAGSSGQHATTTVTPPPPPPPPQRFNNLSGIVTEKTTITFRSRSSRIIWLVQLSAEMWDYCSPYERTTNENICEVYFDKWIHFVHILFEKWKKLEASHSLTVVYFARSFLTSASVLAKGLRDVYGRLYEDHYRVVVDNETGPDWNALIVRLKAAFLDFPAEVGWTAPVAADAHHQASDHQHQYQQHHHQQQNHAPHRQPSIASRGNVLEAINVTLNLLQFHYLDRDLKRTGNSMVIVSAGNGVFEVDKRLAGISYQRMMDNGIGSDVLSLALPALHIAPFFIYTTHAVENHGGELLDNDGETSQAQDYEVPHWMHLSFVSYQSAEAVNVDRLIEKTGDTAKETKQENSGPVLNIGPHGFLLPRTNGPKTAATSPSREKDEQQPDQALAPKPENASEMMTRQLISGRDIRDILDACRPRDFSRLPSALHALLRMKSRTYKKSSSAALAHERFLEWGTMRFEANKSDNSSVTGQRIMSFDNSSSPGISALAPLLMFGSTDLASSQSSFTSQFSIPYLNGQQGTKGHSVLLQRSLSLESADESVTSSDDESSLLKDRPSHDMFENRVREMMFKRDRIAATKYSSVQVELPTTTPGKTTSTGRAREIASSGNRGHQHQLSMSSQGSTGQVGGIGAAMLPFRTPFGGTRFSNADRFTEMARVNSMSRISIPPGSFPRLNDTAYRGPSALFLPPVSTMELPVQDGFGARHHLLADRRQFATEESHVSRSQEDGISSSHETWQLRNTNMIPSSTDIPMRPKTRINFSVQGRNLSSGIASSPPTERSPPKDATPGLMARVASGSRRKKVLNPFRQQDEDEVLKTKSFNRRRWSHVFPRGEVEFKRHAGPNWKSLTAPAILPLGVDYFPSLDDLALNYTFSPYNVALESQDNKFDPKELVDSMVRQRLAQDFQLVSPNSIDPVNFRSERHSAALSVSAEQPGMIRHFLSMGYRMHVLTYDPAADLVEVIRYESKHVRKFDPTFDYVYFAYCQETKSYTKVRQSFSKYADQYNWNRVDRLMCGAEDREIREGMRFRRLMFGLIPPDMTDEQAEKDYVAKFHKLLEYFERMRGKTADESALKVKIVTSLDRPPLDDNGRTVSAANLGRDSMRRFYVQLIKGKALEWLEVAVDSTFDTSWTYRIMFSWLVANSAKVEAQVQMLQRRCTNFQLELVPLPAVTTSSNLFIQPFKAPSLLPVLVPEKSQRLDSLLRRNGYVHDGVFDTDVRQILECMDDVKAKFRFGRGLERGRQFVHPSGALIVRILTDLNEASLLVVFGNYLYMRTAVKEADRLKKAHEKAYKDFAKVIDQLVYQNGEANIKPATTGNPSIAMAPENKA